MKVEIANLISPGICCGANLLSFIKEPAVKNLTVLSLTLAVAFACSTLQAKEPTSGLKSGPQENSKIGAFYVTKVAGAEDDGVKKGRNLCYRCLNGQRPQVMVFTRSSDAKVQELLKKLDKAVAKNKDSQLRVFVNVLGDDKDDLAETCEKFVADTKAKNIPFVVPNEFENGPEDYGINAKAEITVTLAANSSVKASHAAAKASDLNVDAVIKDLGKILD